MVPAGRITTAEELSAEHERRLDTSAPLSKARIAEANDTYSVDVQN